ncbi:hypothetical protein EK904_004380 [Melospiza melodia maxima]|nr:hypothetical protein EK904_004380 [Melospiza melodia maxima]
MVFLYNFYHYFYMLTNVLFYVSSAINPILYNLVSANFRQIFLSTLTILCLPWRKKKKRLAFTRKSNSISSNHTFSSQCRDAVSTSKGLRSHLLVAPSRELDEEKEV